nr:HNH endonuclease signature motif containing protein [Actinopolymorpha pittospori]
MVAPRDVGEALAQLVRERARLDALILDLVRQADVNAVHTGTGAASTAVWVRQQTRMSRSEAGGAVKLAKALDTTLHTTKKALAEGRVSLQHAQEIHLAMGKLPADIDAEVKAQGETALVEQAQTFDPQELRALGERLYQVVAPDDADRRIGEQLAREEKKAAASRTVYFGTAAPGIGTVTMRFERAYMTQLHGMLDALAKPRPGPHGRDTRPYDRRLADAAIEWIDLAQAAGNAPTRGGTRPRITATIPFQYLRDLHGHGVIHTTLQATATLNPTSPAGCCEDSPTGCGENVGGCSDRENGGADGSGPKVGTFGKVPGGIAVSARWLRMLACDAEILPAVLGSDGAILDLGTGTRLFTSSQRHAIGERDGHHCNFPDCEAPEKWCHAHHLIHWADGGPTDVRNGVLICPTHHHLIHHDNWQVRMSNHGHPEYIPPPWTNPRQHPLRR